MRVLFICTVAVTLITSSCKTPFNPAVVNPYTNYLVVEGMVNTGGVDSTIIKLSRTVSLNSKTATQTETGAKVIIENDANATTYELKPIKAGTYAIGPLNLSKTARYRLRIITSNSKIYLSDFTAVKESPPIDSLGYKILPNGLQIYVNAQDARYYRWDFVETYKFHTPYNTQYIASADGLRLLVRTPTQQVYYCWRSEVSTNIALASTAKLVKDILYNAIVTTVPSGSEKVSLGYSILVKQYALTEEAYNYWETLRKNTEQLGSIFDAQPSEINGNIHSINDSTEPVLGYISAGTVQQKRLTVLNTSWPATWGQDPGVYAGCAMDTVKYSDLTPLLGRPPSQLALGDAIPPGAALPIGYFATGVQCADCTLRGTTKKPSFWPN